MAAGIRAMFGTDTKTLHMGRGAQNGLLAAQLASHGFESCSKAIESWARLVSTTVEAESLSALTQGGTFQILQNTFKPYPCGIVIHPLIDAALEAHVVSQEGRSSSEPMTRITAINATVNPQCVRLCSVRHPTTGLETIFSLYHGIAVALLYGQAGPIQFSDQGCKDEATTQLRDKIHVHTDENLADDSAILTITTIDGQEKTFHVEHATGSMAKPMTSDQLEGKFVALASGVLGHDRTHEVIDRCWNLDQLVDMHEFITLLASS